MDSRFFLSYNAKIVHLMANIILSKESSNNELKCYFEAVLKLSQSDNQFPINIEEVWMLAYPRKDHATRSLKENFIEGIDYKVFLKNGENPKGGRPSNEYYLSVSCLEYFIARKVRPVFEVYRQVFHKAVKEPMFSESEIKKHLMFANEAVKSADKKVKQLEKDILKEKAKTIAALEIKEQEQDLKNSCFFFLVKKGLYDEWNQFNYELRQERIYTEMMKKYKSLEAKQTELPF